MAKYVQVGENEFVEFPDDATDAQMRSALFQRFPLPQKDTSPDQELIEGAAQDNPNPVAPKRDQSVMATMGNEQTGAVPKAVRPEYVPQLRKAYTDGYRPQEGTLDKRMTDRLGGYEQAYEQMDAKAKDQVGYDNPLDDRLQARQNRYIRQGIDSGTAEQLAQADIAKSRPQQAVNFAQESTDETAGERFARFSGDMAKATGKSGVQLAKTGLDVARMISGDPQVLADASEGVGKAIEMIDGYMSTGYQIQNVEFNRLMESGNAGAISVADYLANNPAFLLGKSAESLALMIPAIKGPQAIVAASKLTNFVKQMPAPAQKVFLDKLATGSSIAIGALMNGADAFDSTKGEYVDKMQAASVAMGISALAGKLTGGGLEGQLARGLQQNGVKGFAKSLGRAGQNIGKEAGQEFLEEGGTELGRQVGQDDAKIDLAQVAKAGTVGALASAPTSGAFSLAQVVAEQGGSIQEQQFANTLDQELASIPQPTPEQSVSDFLGNEEVAPMTPERIRVQEQLKERERIKAEQAQQQVEQEPLPEPVPEAVSEPAVEPATQVPVGQAKATLASGTVLEGEVIGTKQTEEGLLTEFVTTDGEMYSLAEDEATFEPIAQQDATEEVAQVQEPEQTQQAPEVQEVAPQEQVQKPEAEQEQENPDAKTTVYEDTRGVILDEEQVARKTKADLESGKLEKLYGGKNNVDSALLDLFKKDVAENFDAQGNYIGKGGFTYAPNGRGSNRVFDNLEDAIEFAKNFGKKKTPSSQSKVASPRQMGQGGRPVDGQPIKGGDIFKTLSGRQTTPYPKAKGQKAANQWLIDNAVEEAKSRGDDFNVTSFSAEKLGKGGMLPMASIDAMQMYLFEQQPEVPKPFTKPLVESGSQAIDDFISGKRDDVPSVEEVQAEQAKPADDLDAMFDEVLAEELDKRGVAKPKEQVQSSTERTAGQAAASAAVNTVKGLDAAISGLGELFGGAPNRLGSGPVFDEQTYARAKPLFIEAAKHLANAGSDIREVMRAIVNMVLDQFGQEATQNMKPYAVKFVQDVQSGAVQLAQPENQAAQDQPEPKLEQAEKEETEDQKRLRVTQERQQAAMQRLFDRPAKTKRARIQNAANIGYQIFFQGHDFKFDYGRDMKAAEFDRIIFKQAKKALDVVAKKGGYKNHESDPDRAEILEAMVKALERQGSSSFGREIKRQAETRPEDYVAKAILSRAKNGSVFEEAESEGNKIANAQHGWPTVQEMAKADAALDAGDILVHEDGGVLVLNSGAPVKEQFTDEAKAFPYEYLSAQYLKWDATAYTDKNGVLSNPKKEQVNLFIRDQKVHANYFQLGNAGSPLRLLKVGSDEHSTVSKSIAQAPDGVPAQQGQGTQESGRDGDVREQGSAAGNADAGAVPRDGLPDARSGGSGTERTNLPEAGATRGQRARGSKGAKDGVSKGAESQTGGLEQSPATIPDNNFVITDDLALGQGSESVKYQDNIAAIKVLRTLATEQRRATPQEKQVLARYVGWGGMPNAFKRPDGTTAANWEDRANELEQLLTKPELEQARASTQNAHYTSELIVKKMWELAQQVGFKGGTVLEPSMGTGNFIGLAPQNALTNFVGIELDSLTSKIGQALYPQATVLHSDFGAVPLADNSMDLVIGNPPFGKIKMVMAHKPDLNGYSIHNQFFIASLQALKPGGMLSMVVSRYLLDAQDVSARLAMLREGDLVGAIRLPDTAFKENAKTEVVTDIVVFKAHSPEQREYWNEQIDLIESPATSKDAAAKKRAAQQALPDWVQTVLYADPLGGSGMRANKYFESNSANIIGQMERSGTMFMAKDGEKQINVVVKSQAEFAAKLNNRIGQLAKAIGTIYNQTDDVLKDTAQRFKSMSEALRLGTSGAELGSVRFNDQGQLVMVGEKETVEGAWELSERIITPESVFSPNLQMNAQGKWFREVDEIGKDGKPVKALDKDGNKTRLNKKTREVFEDESKISGALKMGSKFDRFKAMVQMRDLLVEQLNLETNDSPPKQIEANRKRLRDAYDAFVKKHGYLNEQANARLVSEMPDGALVMALEDSFEKGVTAARAKSSGLKQSKPSAKPAKILQERVAQPYKQQEKADSPADALTISLYEFGRVNPQRIAQLRGKSVEEAMAELTEGENPLVYLEPATNEYISREEYLSGEVVKKLKTARSLGLESHVKALEAVQPERWGSENINALIGSTWIPSDVYAQFMVDVLKITGAEVKFSPAVNTFDVSGSVMGSDEYSGAIGALKLFERMVNSRSMKVYVKDIDDKLVQDVERTTQNQQAAIQVKQAFDEWLMDDAQRRDRLTDLFNEKFNTRTTRQWDGSHLKLIGKVPDQVIKMRTHQKNAIWRGISSRFMLIDHAVGAGKTFTAIARVMERRRMGLSKKPMIVVPNHLVEQFASDVYKLYPAAKVLAATKKDFEKARRRKLFAKIATGDFDVVIMAHSSFEKISLSPETEQRFISEEMEKALDVLKEVEGEQKGTGRGKPLSVKKAEQVIDKLKKRLDKLRGKDKDRLLTFEQMGVDDLTIDEAHEFKNLFYSTNLTDVRGMGNAAGSEKAFDLYSKARYLHDSPNGAVVFMTGTPISNSAVEMYSMMRYLAPKQLKELGLENFDAWRSQYVEAQSKFEPTESGSLKEVARLGRQWSNMRSLMELYYSFTDAVSLDDIKEMFQNENKKPFPVPRIKNGGRIGNVIEPTPEQIEILQKVVQDFNALDSISDFKEKNAQRLRLMDRARKVALDARAVDPTITAPQTGGKLDRATDEVLRIYKQWDADKGTQLVFLDRSMPKSKGDDQILAKYDEWVNKQQQALAEEDEEGYRKAVQALEEFNQTEIEELRLAQQGGWNGYDEIKRLLIQKGIPADEIRFIQEANTDIQKQEIFDQVKSGKIRVLLGSTARMGAGTNVQDLLVGLHHIDVTWKPSDIEQREGRIERQGNQLLAKYGHDNFEVEIHTYATERTVDAKFWNLNSTKLKMINSLRQYTGEFDMDFEDEDAGSMEELAALASGDPLMLERVTLSSSIDKLLILQRAFVRKQRGYQSDLAYGERTLETGPKRVQVSADLAEQAKQKNEMVQADVQSRSIDLEGTKFNSSFEAEVAIQKLIEQRKAEGDNDKFIIKLDGQEYSSKDKVGEKVRSVFGDANPVFKAKFGDKEFIRYTEFAKAIIEKGIPSELTSMGQINGYDFKMELYRSEAMDKSFITLGLYDDQNRNIAETDLAAPDNMKEAGLPARISNQLRNLVAEATERANFDQTAELARLGRLRDRVDELKALVKKPFPQEAELKEKQERLRIVEGKLSGAPEEEKAKAANFGVDNKLNVQPRMAPVKVMYSLMGQTTQSSKGGTAQISRLAKLFSIGKGSDKAAKVAVQGATERPIKLKNFTIPEGTSQENVRALKLMDWVLSKNPGLKTNLENLYIEPLPKGVGGQYSPFNRVITLSTDNINPSTGIHELLHHSERMLPPQMQKKIRDLWLEQWNKKFEKADNKGKQFLLNMVAAGMGDQAAYETVKEQFGREEYSIEEYYPLYSPSEFWAMNGQEYLRIKAEADIFGKIRLWYMELMAFLDKLLGKDNRYDLIEAMKKVLSTDGLFESETMLDSSQENIFSDGVMYSLQQEKQVEKAAKEFSNILDRKTFLAEDLTRFSKYLVHPRTIASFYKPFVGVYRAAVEQFERRDQINAELTRIMQPYVTLSSSQKAKVGKVLELGRLEKVTFNKSDTDLDDQEYAGYRAARNAMNRALDLFQERMMVEQLDWLTLGEIRKLKTARDFAKLPRATDQQERAIARAMDMFIELQQVKRQGYVPFTRYGQIGVFVKKNGGALLHFEKVEVNASPEKFKRLLKKHRVIEEIPQVKSLMQALSKKYPGADAIGAFEVGKKSKDEVNLADMDRLAAVAEINSDVWDEVSDALKRAAQAKGFRKHFFGSNNTPGYSQDFERSLADYVVGISGYIARREYSRRFDDSITAIPSTMPELKNYADKYRDYVNTPVEEYGRWRQWMFGWYIAGNLSTALVNLSQQMMTGAYLSQFAGSAKVTRELARANKDALKMLNRSMDLYDPKKAPSDVNSLVQLAWDKGLFVPLQTYENMGQAHNRSRMLRNLGAKGEKALQVAAISFTAAERQNRIATFIATVRLAKNPKFAAKAREVLKDNPLATSELSTLEFAYKLGELAIDETHYRMGKVNRPTFMREVGAPLFQFKSFTFQTLELMVRMARRNGVEGKRAALYIALVFLMLGGLFGLPVVKDLVKAYEGIVKFLSGEDVDVTAETRMALANTFNPTIAELLTEGVGPATLGIDLQSKAGMGEVVPMDISALAGIPAAMASRGAEFVRYAQQDRWDQAVAALMPNAVKNIFQAREWAQGGVRNTRTGKLIIQDEELSAMDIAKKVIGFTPSKVTAIRDAEWAISRENASMRDKQARWNQKLAQAIVKANQATTKDEQTKATEEIEKIFGQLQYHNMDKDPADQLVYSETSVKRAIEQELLGRKARDKSIRKQSRNKAQEIREAFVGGYEE